MSLDELKTELENIADTPARLRLKALFDGGVFTEFDKFLKEDGEKGSVITACGTVDGKPVYAFSQDVTVKSGGMCPLQAEKIKKIYDLAAVTGAPVVGIYDSKGARLEDGVNSLAAYSSLIKSSNNISGVVPQISVVLGVCSGAGAILANTADVVVVSKNALMYVTPANVAGNKTVGSPEMLSANGISAVTADDENSAIDAARTVLSYLPENNLSLPMPANYIPSEGNDDIAAVVDGGSFYELFPDYADCAKVGFARIAGSSVGVIATCGEKLCGKGALKIARFVRLCDAYSLPLINLLNCKGMLGSADAEFDGDVRSISLLTQSYSEATNIKITVITGEAYGSVFAAMACNSGNADMVFALPDARIGVLAPETATEFLEAENIGQKTRAEYEKEYADKCSPFVAASDGLIDDVVTRDELAGKIISALQILASKRVSTLDKKHTVLPL